MKVFSADELERQAKEGKNNITVNSFEAVPMSVIEDIKAEIEEQVLESLSDGGDDWFTAEKVNECLEIIDKHISGKEQKCLSVRSAEIRP